MTDATPFSLTINGESRAFETPPAHVAALIEALALTASRVAVEVNRKIARRAAWSETPLASGDTIEIVHFVGGGA
jgi:thiamine biosynthesis protein ThiS